MGIRGQENIKGTDVVRWVPSRELRGSRNKCETDRVGNNGADALAYVAAKKAGPTAGQGNHYINRQNLC
eukprot:3026829-Heterocapsa_arctica.AAC.1